MKKLIIKQVANGFIVEPSGDLDELVEFSVGDSTGSCEVHVFNNIIPKEGVQSLLPFLLGFFESKEQSPYTPPNLDGLNK